MIFGRLASDVLPMSVLETFHISPDAQTRAGSYGRTRTINHQMGANMSQFTSAVFDDALVQELSERLADVFRTAEAGDVLADDVFLDGNPPLWRFQLRGRDVFDAWIKSFMAGGADTTVVRTIPTVTGFVTEFEGRHQDNGEEITDRKILVADVCGGRITELTIYCSGDWNPELRARHAAETNLIRP